MRSSRHYRSGSANGRNEFVLFVVGTGSLRRWFFMSRLRKGAGSIGLCALNYRYGVLFRITRTEDWKTIVTVFFSEELLELSTFIERFDTCKSKKDLTRGRARISILFITKSTTNVYKWKPFVLKNLSKILMSLVSRSTF